MGQQQQDQKHFTKGKDNCSSTFPDLQHKLFNHCSNRYIAIPLLLFAIVFYISFHTHHPHQNFGGKNGPPVWDFQRITASDRLEWYDCFDEFQCARLIVPMDYNQTIVSENRDPKVQLALIMLPGHHRRSPGDYSSSPLLINPGGPGASGVQSVKRSGRYYQTIVGRDRDIIGFDPRGIGESTPSIDCFSQSEPYRSHVDVLHGSFNRKNWVLSGFDTELINSRSNSSLKNQYYRMQALAKLCEARDRALGNASIFKHAYTANVARDMRSILDAWGVWRGGIVRQKGGPKLSFWGFSYGTLLGTTFAAMFPSRVGHIVVDGVLNPHHYTGYHWFSHIQMSNAVLSTLFGYCHQASSQCDLYRNGDSPETIQERFHHILSSLEQNPISLVDPRTNTPTIISYAYIKERLFQALFSPVISFPDVARWLDAIKSNNITRIAEVVPLPSTSFRVEPFCNNSTFPNEEVFEAGQTITCSDKRYPFNASISDLANIYSRNQNTFFFADVWLGQMLGCVGWNLSTVGSELPSNIACTSGGHGLSSIETSFPLLFITNTADPVGPLADAVHMASHFKGARLIEQKSEGHCSTSAVSLCTIRTVRSYFLNDTLPPTDLGTSNWRRCEPDEQPWKPLNENISAPKAAAGKSGYHTSLNSAEIVGPDGMEIAQAWKAIQFEQNRWIR